MSRYYSVLIITVVVTNGLHVISEAHHPRWYMMVSLAVHAY